MTASLAQVRLRIGDQTLTAVITGDAIDELKLRRGDDAVAIIKSTEVMIARELQSPPPDSQSGDVRAVPHGRGEEGRSLFEGNGRQLQAHAE